MHNAIRILALLLLFTNAVKSFGQSRTEQIHKISGKAKKGYLYESYLNDKGNIEVVYNIKSGKDKVVYEIYEFDSKLGLVDTRNEENRKPKGIVKPDKSYKAIHATVGGGNSFNILSTKLNLFQRSVNQTWDVEKQRYKTKVSETKEFKPRNAENKTFNGNVSYRSSDGSLWVLATSEKSDKKDKTREYSLLHVLTDLSLEETPITFDRPHILIYSLIVPKPGSDLDELDEDEDAPDGDMIFIFAPNEGDLKQYTAIQFDAQGKVRSRFVISAPRNITSITAHRTLADGTIYLCGLAVDNPKRNFDNEIGEYASIINPSYTQYGTPNYRQDSHERNLEKVKFTDFMTAKIRDGKVEWINTTPISEFKSKLRTPPNQKGGFSYDGKRFTISDFYVLPDESFLISGQIKVPVFKQAPKNIQYRDVLALHISNRGELKSQFSYKPSSIGDSKSIIFRIPQEFVSAPNGKDLYWVNYEVKTFTGYASFYDAMYNITSFYPAYYPAIGKISPESGTISNFQIMGDKKFFLNRRNQYVALPAENARVYIGEDKKGKIMLAKFVMD